MKRLILMRHAKSSWGDPGQRDHDRPLNARGRRSAPLVGAWLVERGLTPDAALVSSAARTQETWALLGPALARVPATTRADLYHADPETILRALRAAPEAAATVLVLGHQPGIGEFARTILADPPEDPDFDAYPTAATAVIGFAAETWFEIGWGEGRLVDFVAPRRLEPAEEA